MVILLTGPQAAGKSTVAELVAGRLTRGVHVDGDAFRRFVVGGRIEMTPNASPEAFAQLRLRYKLAACAAEMYEDAGFDVVVADVVAGPMLTEVVTLYRRPPTVVVLLPTREQVAARAARREHPGYTDWTVDALYDVFELETPRVGTWLDTSDLSAEQTADAVLQLASRA